MLYLHILTHFILTMMRGGRYACSLRFTDGETGAQRSEVPFLRSQSSWQTWVLNPGSLATESEFLATHDSCLGNISDLWGGAWP